MLLRISKEKRPKNNNNHIAEETIKIAFGELIIYPAKWRRN